VRVVVGISWRRSDGFREKNKDQMGFMSVPRMMARDAADKGMTSVATG